MSISRNLLAAGVAVATLVIASQASASAFYLQEQSVRGTGRAYSGEVADSGAASLWWNPASIAGLEKNEIYGGLNLIQVDSQVDNNGSTITRPVPVTTAVGGDSRASGPIHNGIVPNFAGAFRINDKLAVGLSVAAPYNFTTQYNNNSWARYDALKSRLTSIDVGGTVAYRINDQFDVGVGVDAVYMDSELTNALPNISPLQPDGFQKLEGNGWDYGWNVGAKWRPSSKLTFGASYRSQIKHTLKGTVTVSGLLAPIPAANNFKANGDATITTPWIATVGARYALTDKLTLNGSVNRIGWSEFDAIRVKLPTTTSVTAQNYKDITTGSIGIDYQYSPRLTLRTGVQYDPTPTPDVGRTARVPDGDRMMYAAGATWQATDSIKWDAAVSYISFDDTKINRTEATATGGSLNLQGNVSGSAVVISSGVRWSF
jgi:long-chain fatty acid transport protein